MDSVLAIVSGGMDSATLAAWYREQEGTTLQLVSFDYGQRHSKELEYAARQAARLGVQHDVVDLTALTPHIASSALTSTAIDVPDGHYAEDSMRITVVPNRNAIMLSIATGIAVARGVRVVATGVHAGDHFIYPDCRPDFINRMRGTMQVANEGFAAFDFTIAAPFLYMSKAEIAWQGARLGVDYADTWSCYKGGEFHCGTCGTCVERREAFALAGVDDPTFYQAELVA